MERMQMYLAGRQRLGLAALARAQRRPIAEIVREALDQYLERAAEAQPDDDALFRLVGAGAGLERARDVSRRHHAYVAKGRRKR